MKTEPIIKTEINSTIMLQRALRVEVAVYKEVYGFEVLVPAINLYRSSFLEIISHVRKRELYIKMKDADFDAFVKAYEKEQDRLYRISEAKKNAAPMKVIPGLVKTKPTLAEAAAVTAGIVVAKAAKKNVVVNLR
jgi:hypothetical protein